jgi:hypothetical protein
MKHPVPGGENRDWDKDRVNPTPTTPTPSTAPRTPVNPNNPNQPK